ncbi:hypothetical protein SHKM778_74340 [Streptomyces sp. KM77-8]|uniref:Uncharacterized protein n=1 Tax=Streptomyces haneummycinicus TaxID=3074435 RepID=A0AAT9HVL5_9ACTN
MLGSTLPVRFPTCLRPADCVVTPFAIQPGQMLTPERCAVALWVDGPAGSWIGVWRPAERKVHHFPAPAGWLAGTGLWTADGVLRLPYATGAVPCGVAGLRVPGQERRRAGLDVRAASGAGEPEGAASPERCPRPRGGSPALRARRFPRPVPLQQAPLGRLVTK